MLEIEHKELTSAEIAELFRRRPRPWTFGFKNHTDQICRVMDAKGEMIVETADQATSAMIVTSVNAYTEASIGRRNAVVEDDDLTIVEAPSAHVTYIMPTYEESQRQFRGHIDPGYRNGTFTLIAERAGVIREPRTLPFQYAQRNRMMSDAETIAAMLRRGVLPVIPEEALAFLSEHRGLKSIWALGAHLGDGRVLRVWYGPRGPELLLGRADSGHDTARLFLVIPKEALIR